MDAEILARVQFALTVSFHYIYPPLSIGLGLILVFMESLYIITKKELYKQMTKFWVKVFGLTFAIGVASGLVQVFEFGTNWATYSRYVGDVFGSALGAEGIFAFLLESGFLAILLFGWDRVKPGMHLFSTIMVAAGAHFSAIWIVVANSWMQTPAGYEIIGEGAHAHAHITDFWAMVFNPSTVDRLTHTIIGAWLAGAFLIISVGAYYLLKQRHIEFAKSSLKIGMIVGSVCLVLQVFSGDSTARGVGVNQPIKLAAIEANYHTETPTPMYLGGIVDPKERKVTGIAIPGVLSLLMYRNLNQAVPGLDQFPEEEWPPVAVVFQTYRAMLVMWGLMVLAAVLGWIYWRKISQSKPKWLLRFMTLSVLFPQIANQMGWYTAEIGRQPWIVYGLLKTSEGLSKVVSASQILGSIIMFGIVYSLLFVMFIYLLDQKIKHGPDETKTAFETV